MWKTVLSVDKRYHNNEEASLLNHEDTVSLSFPGKPIPVKLKESFQFEGSFVNKGNNLAWSSILIEKISLYF